MSSMTILSGCAFSHELTPSWKSTTSLLYSELVNNITSVLIALRALLYIFLLLYAEKYLGILSLVSGDKNVKR
jgi:hypothetical protein